MPPYKADTCWFVKYSSAIALADAGIARVSYLHKTGKIPICVSWHIKQPTKGSTDLSVRSVVLLNPVREGGFADGQVEYHRDIANIKNCCWWLLNCARNTCNWRHRTEQMITAANLGRLGNDLASSHRVAWPKRSISHTDHHQRRSQNHGVIQSRDNAQPKWFQRAATAHLLRAQ